MHMAAIADQFKGLDMGSLIGGPLTAAADASIMLADSTADFINHVGFDNNGKVRTVAFSYQKRSANEDGTSNLDEMKMDIPMLAIVPIPNLQLDEVNVLFDMEVKQSESSQKSLDVGAGLNGQLRLGPIKVSISGSVSVHQENTRKSDNSAKYHVDVRATNHGTPEGLARVLDMMAANVAPALVGSTIKDANGNNLSEKARLKAERRKRLKNELDEMQRCLIAANEGLNECVTRLRRAANVQLLEFQSKQTQYLEGKEESDNYEALSQKYQTAMDKVTAKWNDFQNRMLDMLDAASSEANPAAGAVSPVFGLIEVSVEESSGEIKTKAYERGSDDFNTKYDEMQIAQDKALEAYKKSKELDKAVFDKKQEYNKALADVED
ncbi:hypothetical protein C809_04653 [Lachnospiraceae bacterium MD335]|nr:hypothetical protein C809_04653 [Lachnospiraceae bacterium MD335]